MKRLALISLLVLVFVPSASQAAGCTPLDCGAAASTFEGGSLLAVHSPGGLAPLRVFDLASGRRMLQLPDGMLAATGTRYVSGVGGTLTWFDPSTGRALRREPQRDARWNLVGVSNDGRRGVLQRYARSVSRFQIHGTAIRRVTLRGYFGFDALRGQKLFVLQSLRRGYKVRLYDLARRRLLPQALKDAHESALIRGSSWNRLASPDGRTLFTLYIDGNGGAMIHELDLVHARARCIDLPGKGDWNVAGAYALALGRGGRTLYAANGANGAVVEIDVAGARVVRTVRFAGTPLDRPAFPTAAVSHDGRRLAFALGSRIWGYDTVIHRVLGRSRVPGVRSLGASAVPDARAIAFGRDGRLWAVDATRLRTVAAVWR